jgi:transposase
VHTFHRGKDDAVASRHDANTNAGAARLVPEHVGDDGIEWAALRAISARLGMRAETLRKWVRRAKVDAGEGGGNADGNALRAAPHEPGA